MSSEGKLRKAMGVGPGAELDLTERSLDIVRRNVSDTDEPLPKKFIRLPFRFDVASIMSQLPKWVNKKTRYRVKTALQALQCNDEAILLLKPRHEMPAVRLLGGLQQCATRIRVEQLAHATSLRVRFRCRRRYLCAFCNMQDSFADAAKLVDETNALERSQPGLHVYSFDLSAKPREHVMPFLRDYSQTLSEFFRQIAVHRADEPWKSIAGARYFIEVKRGSESERPWHVHAHAVIISLHALSQNHARLLKESYRQLTGCHSTKLTAMKTTMAGRYHRIRYAAKGIDLSPPERIQLTNLLRAGTSRCPAMKASFGVLTRRGARGRERSGRLRFASGARRNFASLVGCTRRSGVRLEGTRIGRVQVRPVGGVAPYVIIIDEFADLADQLAMSRKAKNDFYTCVRQVAQAGRSRGVHLVLCTQRPSAQLVPSDIRSLMNSRVAFRVNKREDSQMIIDDSGAEQLQMHGDLLFRDGTVIQRALGYYTDVSVLAKIVGRSR